MEEIGDLRKMNLYRQSLRFTHLVLNWTKQNQNEIEEKEFIQIRKKATDIPKYIAKAMVDINIKNKYKKLNHAKDTLGDLMSELRKLGAVQNEKRLVMLSLDLVRLFNGYFGMLNRRKNEKAGRG